MENYSGVNREDEQIELPPGFRFHPTDEELITHYLLQKVVDHKFTALAIGEADFNKIEPWDLPREAKMGEKEWYFFSVKDRKYPTGSRTNRATEAGYWKATGKDKEIKRGKAVVGMKKTLVFYTGRAPRGVKTNWVMHEFRLDAKYSKPNVPKNAKEQEEWVISRVFNKNSGSKKPDNIPTPNCLPPLTDPYHVTSVSVSRDQQIKPSPQDEEQQMGIFSSKFEQQISELEFVDSIMPQDLSTYGISYSNHQRVLNDNYYYNLYGSIDLDSLWD